MVFPIALSFKEGFRSGLILMSLIFMNAVVMDRFVRLVGFVLITGMTHIKHQGIQFFRSLVYLGKYLILLI